MDVAPEILVDVAIASGVVIVQGVLLRHALQEAREHDAEELEHHELRFVEDVVRRACRGSAPDWTWYRSETDRLFEPVDDRLRVIAAATLVTGLGGTILALIAHLLAAYGSGIEPATVIPGMGVALFGSLIGVLNHLLIALRILPRAESRFHRASEAVIHRLHEVEDEHPPADTLIQTFQQELSGLREVLGSQLATAFTEAVPEFPRVVETLATVIERQATTVDDALGDLRESSKLVASSSKRLRPAAEKLAAVSEDLVAMPERLSDVLSTARKQWIEEIDEEQRTSNDELWEFLRELNRTWTNREHELLEGVETIARASERLPQEFSERLRSMADDVGTRFGQEARQYTRELADQVRKEHEGVLQQVRDHEREWQNSLGDSVRRVLTELASGVEERLAVRLEAVSGQLGGVAAELSGLAVRFGEAHKAWLRSHQEALAGWNEVGERVEGAAGALAGGEAHIERSVTALDASAIHLERIARLTEDFEVALQASLREVTARHLEELRPVYGDVSRMVEELKSTRGQFDGILGQQSEFIRDLIQQILTGRGIVTSSERGARV